MADLGTFRVVAATDLSDYAYSGDAPRMEKELRHLERQGLAVERTLPTSRQNSLRVVGLTKLGKRLLRNTNLLADNQAVYHGIVNPRSQTRCGTLSPLPCRGEAGSSAGGRPLRVILDYELKRHLNREREPLGERRNGTREIATLAEGMDGGRERQDSFPTCGSNTRPRTSRLSRIDLELATRHYRPRGLAEKALAGFALYGPREDAPRLRRILAEQELTARIFAL
jgi:hypothetical protein